MNTLKNIIINTFHIIIGIIIFLICWIGLIQIYVRIVGEVDNMGILIGAVGMFVGVWFGLDYCRKFIKLN